MHTHTHTLQVLVARETLARRVVVVIDGLLFNEVPVLTRITHTHTHVRAPMLVAAVLVLTRCVRAQAVYLATKLAVVCQEGAGGQPQGALCRTAFFLIRLHATPPRLLLYACARAPR